MTIEDLKQSSKDILTPDDVAPILGCDPNLIRRQAAEDPAKLGFNVCKMGHRVKIPRLAFISWYEGAK